ncbi:importin-4-like [Schistocerca gregaria]|uniref:importin-4-like n=1 Tax=Schistocerca gregaria TaxID=7010 RepID=UPI00211E4136|nr:importin-4-like [Schistocerca gregaria]
MEEILKKLLVSESAVIKEGSKELKEAFKQPDVIPLLCNVVGSSDNPQIRQYAAVLLRKRLGRRRHWMKLPEDLRNKIKQGILETLVKEQQKSVKTSIAQFVGILVKHELPNQSWPEVLQFIQQLCSSENYADKELGMYTLSVITEISADQFLNHGRHLAFLIMNMMNNEDLGSQVVYYTLLTMIHVLPIFEGDVEMMGTYQKLMPRILQSVEVFARTDENKACEVMELFDLLTETAITAIIPFIKPLVEMCLNFSCNQELDVTLRVKAINLIGWITRLKKKAIIKYKLIPSIVNTLFRLMCLPPDVDEVDDCFIIDGESNTPVTCATQTLDVLALHLPPEKLFTPLMEFVQPGLEGENIFAKKASYLALAVVAEGCAEYIRNKYLKVFLQFICKGITDETPVVRNAALYALGQFSEHLQPDISQYASDLLPVLFEHLGQLCVQLQQSGKEPPGLDRTFYALEMFCENLEQEILPYLPTLMERLFATMANTNLPHAHELVLSAFSAAANAAKEGMIPYFPKITECLRLYLTDEIKEEISCQVQALDTLGTMARAVGAENFLPLAEESIQLGLKFVQHKDEPDLRKAAFGLFASLASIMKEEMHSVLPTIVEIMMESIKSTDGLVPTYKDDENDFQIYDLSDTADEEDIENESGDDDEDDDFQDYTVENSYMEEKEEACLALRELALHTGPAFLPHLEGCFEEVYKLLNYPQDDIRKAAIETLSQFCINFSKIDTPAGKAALMKALSMFVPKCAELIRMDEEREVVTTALEAYTELLKEVKHPVLEGEGHKDAIINCIQDVMTFKTECQDKDDDDTNIADDEPDAEQDELLLECAGDVLPALAKAMDQETFAQYYGMLMPLFLKNTRKRCSASQRSFSVGTLAECLPELGPYTKEFAPQLLPVFLQLTEDESEEVRNNAIFGVGVLCQFGKEALFSHYQQILMALSNAVGKEKYPCTLDNICGALARLIMTNIEGVPVHQVFPVFVEYLPLREDFDENKTVYECLLYLYQLGHPQLVAHLGALLASSFQVLHKKQGTTDTLDLVKNFVHQVHRDFPQEFNTTLAGISAEVVSSLQIP